MRHHLAPQSLSGFHQKGQSLWACVCVCISLSSRGSPLGLSTAPRVEISNGTTDLSKVGKEVLAKPNFTDLYFWGKGWGGGEGLSGKGGKGATISPHPPSLENNWGQPNPAMRRNTTYSDRNHNNNKKLAQPKIMAPRIQQQILPQRRQRVFLQSLKLI